MQNRHIRVFISSTFRDMHAERDYLIKHTFPELRRRCRERGLELTEVDLRWGVTQEQAENGEVLPICLKEIENSRPYFIGLLGERYGWIPPKESIHPSVLESEKWLEEHLDKSVTEMEILHGVLNDPSMAGRAYFYFRNPEFLNGVDQDQLKDFKESDPQLEEKLNRLKEKIRNSGFKVEENYMHAEVLGNSILEDLWTSIDKDYPEDTQPDPLEKEALEHELFAESRRKVYIGRDEYFDRLSNHVESLDPPLVIAGESGSGKTALVANWVARHKKENPDAYIIQHYIGSSAKRTDYKAIMIRIMQELKRVFHFSNEIPDDSAELKNAFPKWLHMAAARGKIILILDSLNQLENKDDAHELFWLPEFFPASIRLIISTIPGDIYKVLLGRKWNSFEVERLNPDERKQIIERYLAQYTKKLDEKHINTITAAKQTDNPLYLKVLLDELRVFGVHEELNVRIAHYLEAENTETLYERILERLETDYEQYRPNLVRDTLSYIFTSRHGLSENELLYLLGSDDQPLPQALWSPLFLAIEEAIVNRLGLLGFFHDYLRTAVYNRYIKTFENAQQLHFHLASYFFVQEISERKLEELPWQCMKGYAWEALYQVLSDTELFEALRLHNQREVYQYWTQLAANSEYRVLSAYTEILEKPLEHFEYITGIASLLQFFSHYTEAYELIYHKYKYYFDKQDFQKLSEVMPFSLSLLFQLDQTKLAEKFAQQYEQICRHLSNQEGIANALNIQANCNMGFKEYDQALELFKKSASISEQLDNEMGIAVAYLNMSNIYDRKEEHENALEMISKAETIARKYNDIGLLSSCLNNRGLSYTKMGKPEMAIELHLSDEKMSLKYGDKTGLSQCYDNLSLAYSAKEDYEHAKNYKKAQIAILQKTEGQQDKVVECHTELGSILHKSGESQEGLNLIRLAEDYFKTTGNDSKYAECLKRRAVILEESEQFEESLQALNELVGFYTEKKNKEGLAQALSQQLGILLELKNFEKMIPLFHTIEEIYTESGQKDELLIMKAARAAILSQLGKADEALEAYDQAEKLCRESEDKTNLAENLKNQAIILAEKDYGPAKQKLSESEQLKLGLQDIEGYYESLNLQADIALRWEQYEDAVVALEKQIEVLNYGESFQNALPVYIKQAEAHLKMGNKQDAAIGLQKMIKLAEEHSLEVPDALDEIVKRFEEED